jgi:hypothetical protein
MQFVQFRIRQHGQFERRGFRLATSPARLQRAAFRSFNYRVK